MLSTTTAGTMLHLTLTSRRRCNAWVIQNSTWDIIRMCHTITHVMEWMKVGLRPILCFLNNIASTSVILTLKVWTSSACVGGKPSCFRKCFAPVTNGRQLRGTRDSLNRWKLFTWSNTFLQFYGTRKYLQKLAIELCSEIGASSSDQTHFSSKMYYVRGYG
jgi:hypothetical protein